MDYRESQSDRYEWAVAAAGLSLRNLSGALKFGVLAAITTR